MKHLILIIAVLLLAGCKSKQAVVSESQKVEETKSEKVEEGLSSMLGLTIDSIVIGNEGGLPTIANASFDKLRNQANAKIYGIKATKHDTIWKERIMRDTIVKEKIVSNRFIDDKELFNFHSIICLFILCLIVFVVVKRLRG